MLKLFINLQNLCKLTSLSHVLCQRYWDWQNHVAPLLLCVVWLLCQLHFYSFAACVLCTFFPDTLISPHVNKLCEEEKLCSAVRSIDGSNHFQESGIVRMTTCQWCPQGRGATGTPNDSILAVTRALHHCLLGTSLRQPFMRYTAMFTQMLASQGWRLLAAAWLTTSHSAPAPFSS